MKYKIMLIIGIIPFILPVMIGIYRMCIESWTMADWLVMYSFIYWPTYFIGTGLLIFALCKLLGKKK